MWIVVVVGLLAVVPITALVLAVKARNRNQRLTQLLLQLDERLAAIERRQQGQPSASAAADTSTHVTLATEPAPLFRPVETSVQPSPVAAEVDAQAIERAAAPIATMAVNLTAGGAEPALGHSEPQPSNDPHQTQTDAWQQPAAASAFEGLLARKIGEWWHWLFDGNWMAKIGAIIFFIGTAFLVKLAAEHSDLPMEARLAFMALGATGALIWGFRLHPRRPGYAEIIEGVAISLLYLLLFAASGVYELLDKGTALPLMLAIVAGGTALALLQGSQSLAVLALLGGFVAPLLTSSGDNNFVGLFSWYCVLNASVLAICWFRPWPFLNRLALVMTFGIGGAWGYFDYNSTELWTVEPFIIAAFLYFVAIGHIFPWRHRQQASFDTGLLFITPILTSVWQAKVLGDIPYALSFSALLAACCYMVLAWLWRREQSPQMLLLREIDLALGVLFATLAIPLAIDGSIASAAWALEGLGLVWLGLRQQRRLATVFGLLLQLAAGILVSRHGLDWQSGWYLANSAIATTLMLALPALLAGALLWRQREVFGSRWQQLLQGASALLLVWGSLWLFGALLNDADQRGISLIFSWPLTAALLCGGALLWRHWPLLQAWLWLALLWGLMRLLGSGGLELSELALGWSPLAAIGWLTLYRLRTSPLAAASWLFTAALWLQMLVVSDLLWRCADALNAYADLWHIAAVWISAVALLLLLLRGRPWPMTTAELCPKALGLPLLVLAGVLLALVAEPGAAEPLDWLPLLNLKTLLFISGALVLLRTVHHRWPLAKPRLIGAVAAVLFIAIHGEIFSAAHYYGEVYWHWHYLWQSEWVQTAMAVIWAVSGLILTVSGHRRLDHPLWWAGAGLLAATVLKLFIVDLDGSGSIARIVSFMGVGGLILAVGYLAPPPRRNEV